jgi:hypothetical protein
MNVTVLIPVFNDWESVSVVVRELDALARSHDLTLDVILVDDGSTETPFVAVPELLGVESVRVVALRRNVGHQRAIAIGLSYAAETTAGDAVVVMDADGQDLPEHVLVLIDKLTANGAKSIVFAARHKRPEAWLFQAGYAMYRWLHLILVGISVRVGNFSIVPRPLLKRLVTMSDLWNHYAASVFASRLPYETVPLSRGRRISGTSKMHLVSLIVHGLSAIAVHSARVGARLLVAATAGILLVLIAMGICWALVGFGPNSVILWMTLLIAVAILAQVFFAAVAILITALDRRSLLGIIPSREFCHFIASDTLVRRRGAPLPEDGP